jgi:hypothetical protein
LHLDIPNTGSKIQSVATGFVGERRDFGIALNGGDRGAGQKLVGCADRAALLRSRQERHGQEKNGQRASHWWKPIRRIFALSVDAWMGKCCIIVT